MIFKKAVNFAFILFLVLLFFSSAFAQEMFHLAEYNLEGKIELVQVTGSSPGNGAQRNLSISGAGQVEKVSHIIQQRGWITVDDNQSWVTASNALNNLMVLSIIELTASPQMVFTTTRHEPLTRELPDEGEKVLFDVIFTVEGNSRLAGVSIQVYTDASFVIVAGDPVFTDDDGVAVKRLPQGDYWFKATKAGFQLIEGSLTVTGEGLEEGILGVDFTMLPEDQRKKPQIDEAVQATFVYIGDRLEDSCLAGTFKDADTGAVVSGILSWSEAEIIVDDSGYFVWIFSPTDGTAYHAIDGLVLVTAKCRPAEKAVLRAEIIIAEKYLSSAVVSTDGKDVPRDELWVPESVWEVYSFAYEEAHLVCDDHCSDQAVVDRAVADLKGAKAVFESCLSYGLLPETVDIAAIEGVEVPVKGAMPVSAINGNEQFTGTITWTPANEPFLPETVYTATIILTAKEGYTISGVSENFFTVAGATSMINRADSGEVVAIFPATEAQIYEIGDIGPSGVGIVFYVTDGGRHGLEAAPPGWSGGDEDPTKQWKNTNSLTGGTLTALGTGYENTYIHMVGTEHSAAAICRDYRREIEGDWFLPSKDELHQMYLNKTIIGGFPNVFYWSSSEFNRLYGWSQSFRTGFQDSSSSKTHGYTYRVRPIRAF